jgi:ribosomal protein S18 acetylase RimI-like enzyme
MVFDVHVFDPMSTLNLRSARPADAATLAKIQHDSIQTLTDVLPSAYLNSKTEAGLLQLWSHEMKSSLRKTFVAETFTGQIGGFVSCGPSEDRDLADRPAGEIIRIYLAPAFMGRGTGTVLLEHGISVLQKRGFEPIMLWVFETNHRARKFYLDNKFEEDSVFRSEDGLRMIRYFWNPNK